MKGSLRNTQGCWTCRVRRKKCDEKQPICSTCESLAITCHGYGPKPAWVDGGVNERAMAYSFKQTVKVTSRRKGRLQRPSTPPKQQSNFTNAAENSNEAASSARSLVMSMSRLDPNRSNPMSEIDNGFKSPTEAYPQISSPYHLAGDDQTATQSVSREPYFTCASA